LCPSLSLSLSLSVPLSLSPSLSFTLSVSLSLSLSVSLSLSQISKSNSNELDWHKKNSLCIAKAFLSTQVVGIYKKKKTEHHLYVNGSVCVCVCATVVAR